VLEDIVAELEPQMPRFDFEERPAEVAQAPDLELAEDPLRRAVGGRIPGGRIPFIVLLYVKVLSTFAILGLTVALLKTRPPQGSDVALFSVILFTTGLFFLSSVVFWIFFETSWLAGSYISAIASICYVAELIAFSVKLGHPHTCGNVDYISNNDLIAGSAVRCGLAKADIVFLGLGKLLSTIRFLHA
jgi:hypothetical protein